MKITLSKLEKLGACDDAMEWFNQTYPNGTELNRETLDSVPDKKWIVWLGSALNPDLKWNWVGIAFRYAALNNPTLTAYADNVNQHNVQAASSAASAEVTDTANTVYAACYFPAPYAAALLAADTAVYAAANGDNAVWNEMVEISIDYLLRI